MTAYITRLLMLITLIASNPVLASGNDLQSTVDDYLAGNATVRWVVDEMLRTRENFDEMSAGIVTTILNSQADTNVKASKLLAISNELEQRFNARISRTGGIYAASIFIGWAGMALFGHYSGRGDALAAVGAFLEFIGNSATGLAGGTAFAFAAHQVMNFVMRENRITVNSIHMFKRKCEILLGSPA